jgi:hypothetical protein
LNIKKTWTTIKILPRNGIDNLLQQWKTLVLPVLFWSLGKIEKSFSPKLPDYFIQGVRNPGPDLVHAHKVAGLNR